MKLNFITSLADDVIEFKHCFFVLTKHGEEIVVKLVVVGDQVVQLLVLESKNSPLLILFDHSGDFIL